MPMSSFAAIDAQMTRFDALIAPAASAWKACRAWSLRHPQRPFSMTAPVTQVFSKWTCTINIVYMEKTGQWRNAPDAWWWRWPRRSTSSRKKAGNRRVGALHRQRYRTLVSGIRASASKPFLEPQRAGADHRHVSRTGRTRTDFQAFYEPPGAASSRIPGKLTQVDRSRRLYWRHSPMEISRRCMPSRCAQYGHPVRPSRNELKAEEDHAGQAPKHPRPRRDRKRASKVKGCRQRYRRHPARQITCTVTSSTAPRGRLRFYDVVFGWDAHGNCYDNTSGHRLAAASRMRWRLDLNDQRVRWDLQVLFPQATS